MGPPKDVFSEDPPQPVVVNVIAKIIAEMDTDRIRDCIVTIASFQTSLTHRRRNHPRFLREACKSTPQRLDKQAHKELGCDHTGREVKLGKMHPNSPHSRHYYQREFVDVLDLAK